jgi:ribosomal-protein-alanine N-acetyltransferase
MNESGEKAPIGPLRPMTEEDAAVVANWHYPGQDAVYDLGSDPEDYRNFFAMQRWRSGFYVAEDEKGVAGFVRFASPEDGVIEVGLGLRLDLVGRGLGLSFLRQGLEFAHRSYHPRKLRLSVMKRNERGIRVYLEAGFAVTRHFMRRVGGAERDFIEMELDL